MDPQEGSVELIKRHFWILVLIAGMATSTAAYGWLRDLDMESAQIEMNHRSQAKLDAIRAIFRQHFDTTMAINAFVKGELSTHEHLEVDETTGFGRVMLDTHPQELITIAIIPSREIDQAQIIGQSGHLDPMLDWQQLRKLSPGQPKIQLVQNNGGRWLTRLCFPVRWQNITLYTITDWDTVNMIDIAIDGTPRSGLDIEVGIIRNGHFTRIYQHRSRLRKTEIDESNNKVTWRGTFRMNGIDFEVRTRAVPAVLKSLATTDPAWTLLLGLILSALLAYFAYNRGRYGERLRLNVAQRTQEAEDEQRKLASIIDHANETVLLIDDNGDILRANPAASAMFGYAPEEWRGMSMRMLLPDSTSRQSTDWIAKGKGRLDTMGQIREIRGQKKDGSVFPCEITVNTFESRGVRHFSAILRDLTERRRQEWARETLLRLRTISQEKAILNKRLQRMLDCMFGDPWTFLCKAGAIFTVEGKALRLAASHGWGKKDKRLCATVPFGECLCGKAIANGEALVYQHQPAEHRLAKKGGADAGYLCAPIMYGGERLGLVNLKLKSGGTMPETFRDFFRQAEEIVAEMLVRERAKKALEQSEKNHRSLVESSPFGIIIHEGGIVRYVNPAMAAMLGVENAASLLGENIIDYVAEKDRSEVKERISRLQQGEKVEPAEEELIRTDGSRFWAEVQGTIVNYAGKPAVQVLVQDISARKKAEERLSWLSYYDELTRLPNRRLFADRAKQTFAIARREKTSVALLYLDIDRFKFINDTLGHTCGDQVLKQVAARLLQTLRASDTAARMGGDEFAVLLPEIDVNKAMRVANKIRTVLQQPYKLGEQELVLDASIGIAIFPQDGDKQDTVLKHADTAMYHAKKNQAHIHYFSTGMEERAVRLLKLEQELAKAADEKQLALYYQSQHALHADNLFPLHYQVKHSLDDDAIIGVESLIRWNHPELGMVSPAEFIPLAEETGLIRPITHWVLTEAARQATSWEKERIRPGRIGVNLSAVQLMQKGLAREIIDRIHMAGAKPEWIEVEITETAVMREPEIGIHIMRELVEEGITIAIDDFGTGYSSLAYLKRLPAEWLKIDIAFIRDLPDDREDAAIVCSIIAMAHALGMRTIAEGVETKAQLEFLRQEGCDAAQGYLLSKPLPADKATAHIMRNLREKNLGNK